MFTIVHKTNDVLALQEVMIVNVLVAMKKLVEFVKVLSYNGQQFICTIFNCLF